ncbi:MAG TPA: hypothetical protein VM488_13150, partial [Pseudobacter sp.]|nr:hypothetical protein [Pseudobacter sp.]
IRNVKRAIDLEARRMIEMLENGETIVQETRSFDATNGITFSLRSKEEANDYRYFADPDLVPFRVTDAMLQSIKESIPELPEQRIARYTQQLQLPVYDARVLCDEKETADYFETLIAHTSNYKAAANWMLGPVKSWLNDKSALITDFPVPPAGIAALIALIDEGKLNFSTASTKVLPALIAEPGRSPMDIAASLNLVQDSDESNVAAWVEEVLQKMPEKVAEYRKGKKGLMGLFVGEVKKVSKGKADPRLTNDILLKKLN